MKNIQPQNNDWDKEFDDKFPLQQKEATHYTDVEGKEDCICWGCQGNREEVKSFIRSLLSSHHKALEEKVASMKPQMTLPYAMIGYEFGFYSPVSEGSTSITLEIPEKHAEGLLKFLHFYHSDVLSVIKQQE